MDEAHRTAVKGESYFSIPLFDEYIAINKRLFVTATPKKYELSKRDKDNEFEAILSMDNEEMYGSHCHTLSFRKAIEQGIISDYKIIFPEVRTTRLADKLQRLDVDKVSESVIYNSAIQLALKKSVNSINASKIITFHTKVADAKNFATSLIKSKALSEMTIHHVNGKQKSGVRKNVMSSFEAAKKSLITNARCLTEGIDAPTVDMVTIFSNKKSKIDIIQAIGRVLRKYPDKECGYIMMPVFVNRALGETYEEALNKPDNQVLFELLLALEQHDELLSEAISSFKFQEGYAGEEDFTELSKFFHAATTRHLNSSKFRRALSIAIVDKLGSNWDKMFGRLMNYNNIYGNCLVPINHKDKQLALWVSNQRNNKKKGLLLQDRIDKLNVIGFNWKPYDAMWQQRIKELIEFKKKYGHCNVPQRYKGNISFGHWIGTVRQLKKYGKLPKEDINKLNSLGFIWGYEEYIWQQRIKELKEFRKTYGHCNVPSKFKNNIILANWALSIRRLKDRGRLSKNQITELDKLGFIWKPHGNLWQQRIKELKEFRKTHGHCNVSINFKDNITLANWVKKTRSLKRQGKLSLIKIKELESLGFVWELRRGNSF